MGKCLLCPEETGDACIEVCEECWKVLGKHLDFNVEGTSKKDIIMSNLISIIGTLRTQLDYAIYALENHKHGIKTVDTVDVT